MIRLGLRHQEGVWGKELRQLLSPSVGWAGNNTSQYPDPPYLVVL